MKKARRREVLLPGFTAAPGFAVALLLPLAAVSQTNDDATLADFRACGALQRDSARLACFDGVLAADREGGEIDETAETASVTDTVAPVAPLAAAEPAETQEVPEPELAAVPAATTPRPERAEATAESVAQSEPIETEPASSSPGEIETGSSAEPVPAQLANIPREEAGATQAESVAPTAAATASDATEASTFTIVEFITRIPGSARFVADDGRVFVQTSGSSNYRTFPDVPFPATLEDGALGSQFLRLGPRLRVRVRTVE